MVMTEAKVLLVEDHDDTRAVLARIFEYGGYHPQAVASAAEAIDALRKAHFDLAIIDWSLPDSDGTSLLRQLRELRAIPAIAYSGFGDDDHISACFDAGFDACMTKPATMEQLLDEAARLLAPAYTPTLES